ncbi:hypothetical protein POAN111098_01000 [Polynucleobacter antarcticus]
MLGDECFQGQIEGVKGGNRSAELIESLQKFLLQNILVRSDEDYFLFGLKMNPTFSSSLIL